MNSNDIAIKVENLGKCYRIGLKENMRDSLGSAFFDFLKSPYKNYRKYRSLYKFDDIVTDQNNGVNNKISSIIWALRDVSFEIKRGETLGIIGENGAGKSTLLKILSRITEPTTGNVEIRGRISSLLEVGTGFHPELTGRENIYLNGTILGMRKREIDSKLDEIVDFSGIEGFIDTPVKRYSTGMKVRLAFSVAANMEPEILLVDEVLAVGDAAFQTKCLDKMDDVSHEGRTVLFVSHNMGAIEQLCERVILLESGKVKTDATPSETVLEYMNSILGSSASNEIASIPRKSSIHNPIIQKLEFFNSQKQLVKSVPTGESLTIYIHYKHSESLKDAYFGIIFETSAGEPIFWLQTKTQRGPLPEIPPVGIIACHIPRLPLVPGTYCISIGCGIQEKSLDYVRRGCCLLVTSGDYFGTGLLPDTWFKGHVLVDADWKIISETKHASK